MKSFFFRTSRLIIALTLMFYQAPILSVTALPGAALEVSVDKFDVDTSFNVVYNWTLDKTAVPSSFVLTTGQTGTTTYTVAVTKTAHSTFSITYTVTIENKGPGTAVFDLYATVQNPPGSISYANEFLEHVTIVAGATYIKTHTTSFDISGIAVDIDPLKIDVNILNSGTTVDSVKHKTSAAINFAATPTNTYNSSIIITDDFAGATGSPWTFLDSGSVNYTRIFSAGTIGIQQYVNTVTSNALTSHTPSVLTDQATVTVTTSNTAPTADNQNVSTAEDTAKNITLTGTDPDSDPLAFILGDAPTHGSLTFVSGSTYTYTPDADYFGPDSFTFRSSDSNEMSAYATVSITVTPVNDAPVALDEYLTVLEGDTFPTLPAIAQLDATDIDNLPAELSFTILAGPSNGSAIINANGTFTYTHDGSETTSDFFTFTVSDGDKSDTGTVYVTITSANDGPDALDENITVNEGGSYPTLPTLAQLDATDPDTPLASLVFMKLTDPAHGTAVVDADGSFTYVHDGSETLTDSFTFSVFDGVLTDTATVFITVLPVNDPPVVADDSFTVVEGGTKLGQLVAVDPDDTVFTFAKVISTTHGSLVVFPGGDYTYIHDGSETTSDSFTYQANDGEALSNIATITITITPVNDPPVVADDAFTVAEGGTKLGQLAAVDPDDTVFTFATVITTAHGSLVVFPGGDYTYIHDGSETTSDSFTYQANDGEALSNIATITITITPVNDGPTATDKYFNVAEGATHPVLPTLDYVTATDPDTLLSALTYSITSDPSNGSVVINPDGSFVYTHDGSETSSDYFTFTVSDGEFSDVGAVYVTVTAGNDAPVALPQTITVLEGGTYPLLPPLPQLGATDADTPSILLSFVLSTPAAHGLVTVYPDGTFTYVHDGTENFSDSFIFTVSDEGFLSSSATVTINVTPVNDPPVVEDEYFNVDEGGTLLEQLVGLDPDDVDLDFEWVTLPSNGSLVVDLDGSITYVHFGDENIFDSFTYRAYDGEAWSNVATVYITVNPVNDPPVAYPDRFTVLEDGIHNGWLMATDPDFGFFPVGLDTMFVPFGLSFVIVQEPQFGTVIFTNPFGDYQYDHDGTENFTDFFTYQVYDGEAWSNIARVDITITPVNDPPVVADDAFTVAEGGTKLGQLVAVDPDDTEITFATVIPTAHGSIVVFPGGDYTYIHDGSENFSDSFTYQANDGEALSNIATITITVTPVNDPPVAYPDRFTVLEDGIHVGRLLATDPESGFVPVSLEPMMIPVGLLFVIVEEPQFGTVIFTSPFGDYQYDHDGTENFTDYFTYQVYDGEAWSNIARVDITITPVNDPPVVTDEYFNVDEAGTLLEQLGATDPDDIEHDFEWVTLPANGSLVVELDGSFTYIHNGSETTSDSFTYKAYDGEAYSNIATVYITVNPVNDPPVANDDGFTVLEGGVHNGQLTGTDPDTLEAEWTYALVTTVVNGTLVLDPDGSYIYTHNGSETTTDSFTFTISDGALLSNTATITIDVTPVNDPPVATGLAFTLLQGTLRLGTLSATDPDDTLLTYALVTGPVYGTLILGTNGAFSYQHAGVTVLPDTFTFNVYDGEVYSNTATVSITVTPLPPVNTAPTALPETFTVVEGGSIDGLVAGNDADGDPILFFLTEDVKNGTLTFAANGAYTYTHNNTETTSDSFKFRVWDGKAYSAVQTATVTVTPVNDAPVAVNGTDETDFNTVLTGNIHGLASDIDSADWTLVVVSTTTHGTLVLNANGSFTYTPNDDFSGIDVFSFKANDGSLDSNVANYTITVNEDVIIIEPETPLSPLSFWWAYLLGLLLLLLFFLRPNLKYALVDKNGNEKVIRRHIFANGKDDLFIDLNDKKVEGLVAVDLVVYKQLVKREQGHKITFNLFKKPMKTISVPEDMKEKIEDQIKL